MRQALLFSAVCLFVTVGIASAQQAANNGGGRALDANQQIGTGGYNAPTGQVDYRARNDLVTGNVQAGRAFRDTVGYEAPGAFTGDSPSNDLFDFRVNSLPSAPSRLNSTAVYNREQRDMTSVYRNFTDVPAYRTGGRLLNQNFEPGNDGLQYGGPSTSRVTGLIAPDIITNGINPARPSTGTFDMFTQPDGSALQVKASPLLGVRRSFVRDKELFNPDDPFNELPDTDDPSNAIDADATKELRVDDQVNTLSSGVGILDQEGAQVATGLVLARQLALRYDPQRPNETIDDRMQRLEQRIYSPLGDKVVEPGQDVYLDLLNAMKSGTVEQPNEGEPRGPFGTEANPLEGELESPTPSQLERAEQLRTEAREAARAPMQPRPGQPPAEGEQDADADPRRGPQGQQDDGEEAPAVGGLVDQLNYDLPRLETMAGQRTSRVNEALRKAEADLAAGKYFSAEALYRQALTDRPNDPLIRAGLVHAQLGAGMIRSAAYNLRILFQEHPELIAAKYDAKLLPAATRLKWVQGELQKMIDDPAGNADAGLMLAYLGYQVDSQQLIRYGLANAEARSPRDTQFQLLRRIWLDEAAGEAVK